MHAAARRCTENPFWIKSAFLTNCFFAYYEDVDLSWRANNFGYKNVYCPTARCRHICGATTGAVRYNPLKSIQSGRNSILLPYKNQPLVMMLLNLIPMVLGYLLKVVMFRFPWVRQRLCERLPRSPGSPAEAEQAEVPLEKPAQLHLGRVQFNCRPVSLPHLPHPRALKVT